MDAGFKLALVMAILSISNIVPAAILANAGVSVWWGFFALGGVLSVGTIIVTFLFVVRDLV